MADDVLAEKVFNYICGIGGFVELHVLLKHSSPLGSRKSKAKAKNWLMSEPDRRFADAGSYRRALPAFLLSPHFDVKVVISN